MDCEKFDHVLMDLLYAELDDLTRASANRHADQCQRCREVFNGLKATRDVGILPIIDPPADLELKILSAERQARSDLPLGARIGRALTIAAGYAMRPQLAMAALLLLMIGSSLLLLRPRSTPGPNALVHVTEHGTPTKDGDFIVSIAKTAEAPQEQAAEEKAPVERAPAATTPQAPAPPSAAAVAIAQDKPEAPEEAAPQAPDDPGRDAADDHAYAVAMEAFRSGQSGQALEQFDAIVREGGRNASAAELYAALSAEQATGCSAALPRFDSVAARNVDNNLGHQATWHSASCRAKLGHNRRALHDFQKLLGVSAYQQRARQALAQLSQVVGPQPRLRDRPSDKTPAVAASRPASSGQDATSSKTADQSSGRALTQNAPTKKKAKAKAKTRKPRSKSKKAKRVSPQ